MRPPDRRSGGWGCGNKPWRYAFNRSTGLLYVADVGQVLWEEVHVVPGSQAAVNHGWRMEGRHCFNPNLCDMGGLDIPVHEYSHDEGCSITGGFVYRGSRIPEL